MGTDCLGGMGALPGWHFHTELAALQRRGIRPLDLLRACTSRSAKHLWRDDLGSIAPGKAADLVVLNADPLADIANALKARTVVKRGVVYDVAKLLAIA